jgi:hypothetical protein
MYSHNVTFTGDTDTDGSLEIHIQLTYSFGDVHYVVGVLIHAIIWW